MKTLNISLMAIIALAMSNMSVQAQIITAITPADLANDNPPPIVNSIPVAGTGDSGYYIFGELPGDVATNYVNVADPQTVGVSTDAGINGLESWATISFSNAGNAYSHTTDSQLDINGITYTTVENFNSFTLTLGAGAPAAFTLGVLANNSSDSTDGITVSAPTGGSPTSTSTIVDQYNTNNLNDFYYFSVTGAAPGDTIEINQGGGGLGGITLSAVAAPEPSTYVLMLTGLGILVVVSRRHRQV